VQTRDSILLADRVLTGGENQAIIWRAFASHGVGAGAASSGDGDQFLGVAPAVREDFAVPEGVTECERLGPLRPPSFTVSNSVPNAARISINGGNPVRGASGYAVSRTDSDGRYREIATLDASQTGYLDGTRSDKLQRGTTYRYRVRAARSPECVSGARTRSVTIRNGADLHPASAPVFSGLRSVTDPRTCSGLVLRWRAARSANPRADVVYDVYRVGSVGAADGVTPPRFVPSKANVIARGVRGLSYTDRTTKLGRISYYIVQARDLRNGRIDTSGKGNRVVRFSAPTSRGTRPGPFAVERFDGPSADARFVPPLITTGDPVNTMPLFQRVENVHAPGVERVSSMMYGPDALFLSEFATAIGPLTPTARSVLRFDHAFATQPHTDGGVVEIVLGASPLSTTLPPDGSSTFDAANFMIRDAYNGMVTTSFGLGARRAFTGRREGMRGAMVALGSFAPGGLENPSGLPVYARFRMISDPTTTPGPRAGWYVDNLAVDDLDPARCR
jgi:hypothetical protein